MARTTVSLVAYQNRPEDLESLMHVLAEDPFIAAWVIVDNSASEDPELSAQLCATTLAHGGIYIPSPRNVGFGAGHNSAMRVLRNTPSDFHLMLNPDIGFDASVLPALAEVMDARPEVGLVMPRVYFPNGVSQAHCHLLPTPVDLILRRFAPLFLKRIAQQRMLHYDLRAMDKTQPAEVPFFSGCFLFMRRSLLDRIGGFDERFLLYMEDVDLCRRLAAHAELVYWPAVSISHVHQRGSYKNVKLTRIHAHSALLYFSKWGWFVDRERTRINDNARQRLLGVLPTAASLALAPSRPTSLAGALAAAKSQRHPPSSQ
ncbi:MAG: glycosyltransferase family 2 protein [Acidobacteriota bacterium]